MSVIGRLLCSLWSSVKVQWQPMGLQFRLQQTQIARCCCWASEARRQALLVAFFGVWTEMLGLQFGGWRVGTGSAAFRGQKGGPECSRHLGEQTESDLAHFGDSPKRWAFRGQTEVAATSGKEFDQKDRFFFRGRAFSPGKRVLAEKSPKLKG